MGMHIQCVFNTYVVSFSTIPLPVTFKAKQKLRNNRTSKYSNGHTRENF